MMDRLSTIDNQERICIQEVNYRILETRYLYLQTTLINGTFIYK